MITEFDLLDDLESDEGIEALEEIDLQEEEREQCQNRIEYPCIRIEGLNTVEEFEFFREKGKLAKCGLPLYSEVDGILTRVGEFEISVDSLLSVKNIADYGLILMTSPEEEKRIELNDPLVLMKFIRFDGR